MRSYQTHVLAASDGANQDDAQTQLDSGGGNAAQTQALEPDCSALLLSARTQNCYVTFNDTVPSATNGLEIVAGAQPIYIPLGYNAQSGHNLKMIGAAANAKLNIVQLN